MPPSRQRLDPHDLAVGKADDRLIDHVQLVRLEGVAQLRHEGELIRAFGILLLGVYRRSAGGPLRDVHRHVGAAHERLDILSVLRADRDADRDRDLVSSPLNVEWPLQRRDDLLGNVSRAAFVGTREDQRELVAAKPCHRIGLAEVGGDAPGDLADKKVAGGVPEGVVDLLEPVKVHHEKSERCRETPRGPERLLEAVQKERAVRKTGERVVQSESFELVLGFFAIGHVGKARDDLPHSTERVLNRNGVDEQPPHVPIRSDHPHHDVADRLAACLRRDVRDLVVGHGGAVLAYAAVFTRGLGALELLGRSSEDAFGRSVREDDGTGGIAHDDAARHRVVDGGEVVLRSWHRHRGTPDVTRPAFRARSARGIGSRPGRLRGGALSAAPSLCR